MIEEQRNPENLQNLPSASLTAGMGSWGALLLIALPLTAAANLIHGPLHGSLEMNAASGVFLSFCMGYGGVVAGFCERGTQKGRRGLALAASALTVVIVISLGAPEWLNILRVPRKLDAVIFLPFVLGPLLAPLTVWRTQRRRIRPILTLVFFWLVPTMGLFIAFVLAEMFRPSHSEVFWRLTLVPALPPFGPWLRPLARVVVPLVPCFPGTAPEWRPGDDLAVPAALVISIVSLGIIVVFAVRHRWRRALVIPYVSLTSLWVLIGFFQLIIWLHQGE